MKNRPAPAPFQDLPESYVLTMFQQIAMHLLGGCNGDLDAAREAASDLIGTRLPKSGAEFRLVARIIACELAAGEALSEATDHRLPINVVMRLRTSAVSLNRQADKTERQLEKLRKARMEAQARGTQAPEHKAAPSPTQTPQTQTPHTQTPQTQTPQTRTPQTPARQPQTPQPQAPLVMAAQAQVSRPAASQAPAAPALPTSRMPHIPAAAAPTSDSLHVAAQAGANGIDWMETFAQHVREQLLAARNPANSTGGAPSQA